MSGNIVEKFWCLDRYCYVYYRFLVDQWCQRQFKEKACLMLDAGCGSHVCSLSHVPKNVVVVAIDVNRSNIVSSHRRAKEKGYMNFNFLVGDITTLPLRHATFKLAICVDVLEHVKTKREVIEEVARICKVGGVFVGSTSNLLNPLFMLDSFAPKCVTRILANKFAGEQCERESRFTCSKLTRILRHANFVCDIKLVGMPLFQPWLYHFSDKKLPWYAWFWIAFDKITRKRPLDLLKEMVVFYAVKQTNSKCVRPTRPK